MSLLVVGVSHHTAPVHLLERLAIPTESAVEVLDALAARPYIAEAVLLSTCNRVEVYAVVHGFHGGLAEIGAELAERAGLTVAELVDHMYVHYDEEAVRHALRVAAGLDSMVVGEAQILGQLRDAYGLAVERDTAGRLLHELMQQALRVGKRVHAETSIDRAGQSIVTAALSLASARPGSALVIGAGSMGALTLATLRRQGIDSLFVTNRGAERAQRLAELHGAVAVDVTDLIDTLAEVDLVVCATASVDPVLTVASTRAALAIRPADQPLIVLDLAVPRDVEPAVAELPGVTLIDLARLNDALLAEPSGAERQAAEEIVATEIAAFASWRRGADVAPTVAALRSRADEVVGAELRRLHQRRPDLSEVQRAEVAHTVHRVVQRLLHSPTVRVRQLASEPGGAQYADALRELFDLQVPAVQERIGRAVEIESDGTAREVSQA